MTMAERILSFVTPRMDATWPQFNAIATRRIASPLHCLPQYWRLDAAVRWPAGQWVAMAVVPAQQVVTVAVAAAIAVAMVAENATSTNGSTIHQHATRVIPVETTMVKPAADAVRFSTDSQVFGDIVAIAAVQKNLVVAAIQVVMAAVQAVVLATADVHPAVAVTPAVHLAVAVTMQAILVWASRWTMITSTLLKRLRCHIAQRIRRKLCKRSPLSNHISRSERSKSSVQKRPLLRVQCGRTVASALSASNFRVVELVKVPRQAGSLSHGLSGSYQLVLNGLDKFNADRFSAIICSGKQR